ncbi:MAG TPA: phosphatidylserine decarboxylase [Pseudonocardiaceae bacterium]
MANVQKNDLPESPLTHLVTLARDHVPPMHPAGRPLVYGLLGTALVGRALWRPLGVIGAVGAAAVALFFREPRRVPPELPFAVAAAADGTVCLVDEATPPAELGMGPAPLPRVSVFLSVFDVHVQRAPVAGRVTRIAYRAGRFLSADLDKASEDNERNSVLFTTPEGHEVAAVQIAGLVARRIVCEVTQDEHVDLGATYGLIRFGSRVDVYLPAGSTVLVRPGQRTVGGETILAQLPPVVPPADAAQG